MDDIQNLNQMVETISSKEAQGLNSTIDIEVKEVVDKKRKVYKNRVTIFPKIMIAGCVFVLFYEMYEKNFASVLISLGIMYVWYDLFSGILHVVLDNPKFINYPLIDEACLEFLWHHKIPRDITMKSYWEVCGDLNLVVVSFTAFYLLPKELFCCGFKHSFQMTLLASKILMAYFGQYCHRMSHTPIHKRSKLVTILQNYGIMISAKEHLIHHHHHDKNFCIGSGMFNKPFGLLLKYLPIDDHLMLLIFVLSLYGDIPLINYLAMNLPASLNVSSLFTIVAVMLAGVISMFNLSMPLAGVPTSANETLIQLTAPITLSTASIVTPVVLTSVVQAAVINNPTAAITSGLQF